MRIKKYLGPEIPKDWRTAIKPFVWGLTLGLLLGLASVSNQLTEMQRLLDDPHHCVSVCVEEFERMGC